VTYFYSLVTDGFK